MVIRDGESPERDPMDSEPGRERELVETLRRLVRQVDPSSSSELNGELERLEASYGTAVYDELIHLLCHLRFRGPEAKRCWHRRGALVGCPATAAALQGHQYTPGDAYHRGNCAPPGKALAPQKRNSVG